MGVVVDTNVAVVASGRASQADAACVDACIQRLFALTRTGGLCIDDQGLILAEYTRNLGFAGAPGAGEKFVKWAFSNQANPEAVRTIAVTRRTDGGWRRFEEFPADEHLQTFDPADQKFVAVALGDPEFPPVLNAVDSHWAEHHAALAAHGVRVEFLCPQHCSPGWRSRRAR